MTWMGWFLLVMLTLQVAGIAMMRPGAVDKPTPEGGMFTFLVVLRVAIFLAYVAVAREVA